MPALRLTATVALLGWRAFRDDARVERREAEGDEALLHVSVVHGETSQTLKEERATEGARERVEGARLTVRGRVPRDRRVEPTQNR